jgi:hypothetical protein
MKQQLRILITTGVIIGLFTLACNKNNQPGAVRDNISNALILTWNEVPYEAKERATDHHRFLESPHVWMIYAEIHDASNATDADLRSMHSRLNSDL